MQKIYGISLGPGDPELISLKALRILRESDMIFYPGSLFSDGRKESFVLPILQYHQLEPTKLQGFFLKMSDKRVQAEETYSQTVRELINAYQAGKQLSVVCEGDISFYASFSYILKHLQQENIPVELVPGINSFSLGAARHQVPLCLQNEKVAVLPREASIEKVEQMLETFDTLILMKIRSGWDALGPELLRKNWKCFYCERLGTADEYITSDLRELQQRAIPYFSLLIIQK